MTGAPNSFGPTLRPLAFLSTIWLLWMSAMALAHEVTPTTGDLTVAEGRITLDMGLNIEVFVAGVDLDGLENINTTDQANTYRSSPRHDPEALEPETRAFAETWVKTVGLLARGQRQKVTVTEIEIALIGAVTLPCISRLVISAPVPPDATTVAVA